jgi:hypothetical protein
MISFSVEQNGKKRGHKRLAYAAFAAYDSDDLPDRAEFVGRFDKIGGILTARRAAFAAG